MQIIDTDKLVALQRMAKYWWAGWVIAAAALFAALWATSRAAAYDQALKDVYEMADDVDRLRATNQQMLSDVKTMQRHQDGFGDAIIDAAQFLRHDHQDLMDYNRSATIDLTKTRRRR